MNHRRLIKLFLVLAGCCFCVSVILVLSPLTPSPAGDGESCGTKCPSFKAGDSSKRTRQSSDGHKLAVIVPFRNRFEQLLQFVPHIHKFLSRQSISHTIYIINQAGNLRFNRASLINIGYLTSINDGCDYLAMHDVDLLPLNNDLKYSYPGDGTPFHVSSPELHPKYHYKTFVGGILLLTASDFELVNGMSNKYWGWGLEDDEFYARMMQNKLNVTRPNGITTGTNDTFLHIHDQYSKRDTVKLFNQKEVTRRRDRETGVNNVQFKLVSDNEVLIDKAPCRIVTVELKCDYAFTPWCDHKFAAAAAVKENGAKRVKKKERNVN